MNAKKVSGNYKGDVFLFTLSTCVWCKKTKQLLNDLGIEYSYVDVDLCNEAECSDVEAALKRWNPSASFPTIVFGNSSCVIGYKPDEIKAKLKI